MINRLSKSIALFFAKNSIISNDDIDSYTYMVSAPVEYTIEFLSISLIMIYSGKIKETILYITSTFVLRHHTGGYHAKTLNDVLY